MGRLPVERLRPPDPGSGVPRYRQIADQIAALITDAEPGVRLPSEHEMAAHLGVSRATAIQTALEAEEQWSAGYALRAMAAALDVPAAAPVMRVRRRAFQDGTPAEYALSFVRAETFAVSFRIVNSDETRSRITTVEAEVP